jgi:hypothetical protein
MWRLRPTTGRTDHFLIGSHNSRSSEGMDTTIDESGNCFKLAGIIDEGVLKPPDLACLIRTYSAASAFA